MQRLEIEIGVQHPVDVAHRREPAFERRGLHVLGEYAAADGVDDEIGAMTVRRLHHGLRELRGARGQADVEAQRRELLRGARGADHAGAERVVLFASKMDADPAKVRQALMRGFAASRILEIHGERMVKRTFEPGFRIELHQKDLKHALSSARAIGVSLPNTATAQELFNACTARGGAAWDPSGMVRALEMLSNFEIGQVPAA